MPRSSADQVGESLKATASRRAFLQASTAALASVAAAGSLPDVARGGRTLWRGTSVIFVYLAGGPSHLDMYDMKPQAPVDIRGEFRPIATRVPGMQVCEHLPLHAKIADKLAIVNGVETIDTQSDSVITSGYLAQAQRPSVFEIANALASPGRGWKSGVGKQELGVGNHKAAGRGQAVASSDPMSPFRPFTPSPARSVGAALSLAENGVPAVLVRLAENCLPCGDWDTHGQVDIASAGGRVRKSNLNIFQELRAKLPVYDRVIYRLVTEISHRGLDRDVLVVACGEFGRTPWVNRYGGRNHWAACGSVLFAGGGLRMGQVIGDTGPIGERSRWRPYTAQNVLATIYRHLGIDPAVQIQTADGQTAPLLDERQVIEELL